MDQSLFHAINQQWTSPALDLFMAGLSDPQIWMPFLIVIGIGALVFGGFKARALVICLVISLAIAGLVTSALKSNVAVTDRNTSKVFGWCNYKRPGQSFLPSVKNRSFAFLIHPIGPAPDHRFRLDTR